MSYTKYYYYKKQQSSDNGQTWTDVYPSEMIPSGTPIGTYDTLAECEGLFKLLAHYSDASTYLVACDSSNELTVETIRAHSTSFTAMTNAVVGSCVSTIGENAFTYCENLTSVTIHNSVTTIGNSAFDLCKNLTNITIPSSVTTIGDSAFRLCSGLTSIDIPSSVTIIENNTFQQCYSLTDVIIPNNVTSIGQAAFYECSGITSVSIGTSVASIGDGAFEYCESLTAIDIPNTVTSIGEFAFQGCRSLTSLTIPSSVASIGHQAFAFCSGLTSITCLATTPATIGEDVFSLTNNCPIYVPCASLDAYKAASGWSTYADRIEGIPPCGEPTPTFDGKFKANYNNGTSYSAACDSSSGLSTSDTKPTGYEYTAMTNAEIGDCVTSINAWVFKDCESLSSVTIPNSLTTIGNRAFSSCKALSSINIPNSVTSIGEYAFYLCTSLTSVTIPTGVTSISNGLFGLCETLSSITFPSRLTSIGEYAFYHLTWVEEFVIPEGVTTIGNSAFEIAGKFTGGTHNLDYKPDLELIDLPSTVTEIGECTLGFGDASGNVKSNFTLIVRASTPPTLPNGIDAFWLHAWHNGEKVYANIPLILVPSGSVNAYKTANGWSRYASVIQAIP